MKDNTTNELITEAIDHLLQANYDHNRKLGESPNRLALVFGSDKVELLEKNFQQNASKALTQG